MRRGGNVDNMFVSLSRQKSIRFFIGVGCLYMVLITLEIPLVFKLGFSDVSKNGLNGFAGDGLHSGNNNEPLESEMELEERTSPIRPFVHPSRFSLKRRLRDYKIVSGLVLDAKTFTGSSNDGLQRTAMVALEVGRTVWGEVESGKVLIESETTWKNRSELCPHSISLTGDEFLERGRIIEIPCGLTLGSYITVVGKPRAAHQERDPKIALVREGEQVMVSQFMMELQGLKTVDGEDPPRILHFNPRLSGDWSGKPVIEQNTCYRMQWGTALRCEGWGSRADEETVDGQVKCEKWIRDDDDHSEESKALWWLNRLIGRTKKVTVEWPFPFSENNLFVLTLSAGFEGYHVSVDGRHVTSFPYRLGFSLEDATGLALNGDVDIKSIFAVSLPTSHPSYAPQRHLEMSNRWKAPPISDGPVELFIGILSAGNHFAERMAVRKSWMQHKLIKSSIIVARFFVALVCTQCHTHFAAHILFKSRLGGYNISVAIDLFEQHARKDVNVEFKKEADFFGDMVIVPYMDNYDLVVLKTVAICEYGVRTVAAEYVMKCDDDTFIKLDVVLNEARKVPNGKSLYVGNINYHHKPLRHGKWAVTFEEWPEADYPPYANGPGYILSSNIAHFIVSQFEKHKLRLFKMEDVSMGMWVEQFNTTNLVKYVHSDKFCQFGCIEGYYTAHYQSPRQMTCLWDKLQRHEKPQCCNMR